MVDAEVRAGPLLTSPSRRRMLEAIRQKPGITLTELVERLNMGWGSAYLHLDALEDAGLVTVQRVGRRRLVFAGTARRPPEAALLRGRSARAVAVAVCERPSASVLDLCGHTGLSARAIYYHVRRLALAGLLTPRGRTRQMGLAPTERLRKLLDEVPDEA